ncbi:hypothetical protein [Paenibacillus thermotolerans]|uniref:hypothetical protein n=1 Tax=Paenibacillus thermotolerans TaxID=3027807 RepID=UPI00236826E8|nr:MULTISPECIES: hypothetical protein [unclassified Paenibacillus]
MPNVEKHPLLAIMLTVIPGFGHFYIGKYGRGLLYAAGAIAPLFLLFFIAVVGHGLQKEHLVLLVLYWLLLVFVSFIDMAVTLSLRGQAQQASAAYPAPSDDRTERFQTALLSVIPGLGHMYLGLLQRGLCFFAAFFGGGILSVLIAFLTRNEKVLLLGLIAMPVIWIFGQWDAAHALQQKQKGELFPSWGAAIEQRKLAALLFSLFPGAGHLYLGQRRKGVQLMALFLLSLYLGDQLDLTLLGYALPMIWFYGVFDVYHRYAEYLETEEALPGGWIVWIGWFLILTGFLGLIDKAMFELAAKWLPEWNVRYWTMQYVRPALFSVVLIVVGVRMLLKKNKGA